MLTVKEVLKVIRSKVDHPCTVRELMLQLQLAPEDRGTLRKRLASLVESGSLIKVRGGRYGLPDRMRLVTGRIQVNPRGFGFVTPEESVPEFEGDLFIASANLKQAMHGDRVVARVEHRGDDNRGEGRIVRILERAARDLVGRFDLDESGLAYVVPFDRRLIMDVHIPSGEWAAAKVGEMVLVELTRWPTSARGPVGRVSEVLGDIESPGVDTQLIIRKHRISDDHSDAAINEAKRLGKNIRKQDLKGRQDYRSVITVTIDGETARDFDDAITLERLPNGNYWLGVHIADVSHYVPKGGRLDIEAYERGTSVYFPDRAVHMFPEELSTGLCSLNPNVDRLVQSCLMEIDGRGTVVKYETHDGVIHSDARMTYSEVNSLLNTEGDADVNVDQRELLPLFKLMADLFKTLNKRRRRRGSIDFDLPSAEFVMDDQGKVEAIVASERNVAHRIIEEFMLVANETIAAHLEEKAEPCLYRVHEAPYPKKVEEFENFAASLGYGLGAPSEGASPLHFQKLLSRVKDTPEERALAFLMLRTMQAARYDPKSLGHFGLATSTYTHFTSPIRRYPDLVVHRALKSLRAGGGHKGRNRKQGGELLKIAVHNSDMERLAENAEREAIQWKKVRFMTDKVGEEFTGCVTGVTSFGLFVELVEQFVEGLVHLSTMADDYYRFVERQHELRGENSKKVYRLGDLVCVQLVRVDREHRQLELALTDVLESTRRTTSRRKVSKVPLNRKKKNRKQVRRGSGRESR